MFIRDIENRATPPKVDGYLKSAKWVALAWVVRNKNQRLSGFQEVHLRQAPPTLKNTIMRQYEKLKLNYQITEAVKCCLNFGAFERPKIGHRINLKTHLFLERK